MSSISTIIPNDSYFNELNEINFSERERFYYEALRHLFRSIQSSYSELDSRLSDTPEENSEAVMSKVWGLIDNYYRLYKILNKTPGIKKKLPWFQVFTKKLQTLEDIRNFHQHIDNELDNILDKNKPILGHIGWVEVIDEEHAKTEILIPGFAKPGMDTPCVNPVGIPLRKNEINLITYFINDNSVCLSDLMEASIKFIKELEDYTKEKNGND